MYYLIALSYRDVLFNQKILDLCEKSVKNDRYYVPKKFYLILKNKNLC